MRRERTLTAKARLLEAPETVEDDLDQTSIPDERLALLFACCQPALATEAQVALTLRTLGGLSTEEIARAFIVAPETMKRRLSRAKAKIRVAGIPFGVPPEHLLPERLAAVLALMLLHDSRRRARFVGDELVLLADQDRSLWNLDQVEAGRMALERGLALRGRGQYVLQAAIASLRAEDRPDWPQIVTLYVELTALTGSPVVELNRAVAVAEAGKPRVGREISESGHVS